jgi:uncharacterized protein (TIGR00369 family)
MNTYQACLQSHANCVACSDGVQNPHSLQLKFTPSADNKVTAYYRVDEKHQGYTNLLHGGIASTLLDAAMTHCLLSQGIEALTAELNIRFHAPIKIGDSVQIIGRLLSQRRGIYLLEASLSVAKQICVKATGKFIQPKEGVIHRELSV